MAASDEVYAADLASVGGCDWLPNWEKKEIKSEIKIILKKNPLVIHHHGVSGVCQMSLEL